MDDGIIRFMVATDNHLGVFEKDPIRGGDSFSAFEEVLRTALARRVDFVLLAGDLFHENRPSRHTLHASFALMRRYCFGGRDVFIRVLSDQKEVFRAGGGRVNYEDPYLSIALPVFAIHGNHDDPSRESFASNAASSSGRVDAVSFDDDDTTAHAIATNLCNRQREAQRENRAITSGVGDAGNIVSASDEALSALDLAAVSSLVNYFGKSNRVDDIEILPILIEKTHENITTKIAIYGLGAVRDERLHRMWEQKKVRFVRLTVEQGRDDYFNLFVLHQNRDSGRSAKGSLSESMIPAWMDLVIWGNEHECQPELVESLNGSFRILQPGSSVATSLNRGESSECPKNMAIFQVRERQFRMKAVPFKQVRPFIYDDICLREVPSLDPNHPHVGEQIQEVLRQRVTGMIAEARAILGKENKEASKTQEMLEAEGVGAPLFSLAQPEKVLVRLKVDYEGFSTINQQRFGMQFSNDVANPSDILLFGKKRRETFGGRGGLANGASVGGVQEELQLLLDEGEEDALSKIRIEDLVKEALQKSHCALTLLEEDEMGNALNAYVTGKNPNAIRDAVEEGLKNTQKKFSANLSSAELREKFKVMQQNAKMTEDTLARLANVDGFEPIAEPTTTSTATKGRGRAKAAATEVDNAPTIASSRAKRATRAKTTVVDVLGSEDEGDDDDIMNLSDGEDYREEEDNNSEIEEVVQAPARGRGRTKKTVVSAASTPAKGRGRGRGRTTTSATPSTDVFVAPTPRKAPIVRGLQLTEKTPRQSQATLTFTPSTLTPAAEHFEAIAGDAYGDLDFTAFAVTQTAVRNQAAASLFTPSSTKNVRSRGLQPAAVLSFDRKQNLPLSFSQTTTASVADNRTNATPRTNAAAEWDD